MFAPIQLASAVAALSFLAHAVFSQYYETGFGLYIAPVTLTGMAYLFVAFILRKPWTWPWAHILSLLYWVRHLIRQPSAEQFDSLTMVARVLFSIECLSCMAIWLLMRQSSTKKWFFGALPASKENSIQGSTSVKHSV